MEACRSDQQRQIAGHELPVGAAMLVEHDYLRPLATEGFDLAETFPIVDGMGCARVRTDFYSVPLRVGAVVEAKVYSTYGEMWLP